MTISINDIKRRSIQFVIVVLAVYAYKDIFVWMYGRFTADDSYYSHGFLVPLISTYLVWDKRAELRTVKESSSRTGFLLILIALSMHVASTALFVFFPSGISLVLLIVGMTLFFKGLEYTRVIIWPLLFLFFMVPLPMDAINKIAVPFKLFVSWISASIIHLLGFPVYSTGFFVETTRGQLVVDNPCSGLRSLIAFLALGFLTTYFSRCSGWKKILIFSSSFPIAIVSNIMRVCFLILLVIYYGPSMGTQDSLPHDIAGYVVFIIGATLLYFLGKTFNEQT